MTVDTSGPILAPNNGPEGYAYTLPAAGTRADDGTYVLFVAWFGALPGTQVVTVARSEDARDWDVDPDPIYTDLGLGFADPGPIPTAVLQLDDGTWVLYGWGSSAANSSSISSWRATAPAPEGPWTADEVTGLGPDPGLDWASQSLAVGSVERTGGGGWQAWFEGQPPGREVRGDIGLATSDDGLAWTAVDEPVIGKGICGEGTHLAVQQPQVERLDDLPIALFGGFARARSFMDVYGAVSADGEQWDCASLAPLVTQDDVPDSRGIHTISTMPLGDGRVGLLIESLSIDRSEVWLATVERTE